MFNTSTIFALSSGAVPSGVAVVRVSGSGARYCLETLCGAAPDPRRLVVRPIAGPDGLIDRGLVVFLEGPHSFTGEDCVEFHVHGSRAVIAALLEALGALPGFRQAEAGEFTKRAFINGKLDLTGAEALSDLIVAETGLQRQLAQSNADGRQAALYSDWRQRLLRARSLVEAELDFSDEADVPGSVSDLIWGDMLGLQEEMRRHLERFRAGEIVRDGFRVVILGPPNAGKSSLLNCLAGRDVAIVTDEPGTTRDVLEVALALDGMKVILSDTAGIREQPGVVEAIGIDRAHEAARRADLVLLLEDVRGSDAARIAVPPGADVVRVATKSDMAGGNLKHAADVAISSRSGAGIDELLRVIGGKARELVRPVSESAVPTRQRHLDLVSGAVSGIADALDVGRPLELRVEGLRVAGDRIGRLSGQIGTEDVLGEIFSAFCIGK